MHARTVVIIIFCQVILMKYLLIFILSHAEKLCRMSNSVGLLNDSDIVINSFVSYAIMFITCNYIYCIYKILCKCTILLISVKTSIYAWRFIMFCLSVFYKGY